MAGLGFSGLSGLMKTIVVVSLAANLLVVGFLATAWHRHGGKHWRGGGIERSLMHFAHRELPRDKRRALRDRWHTERDAFKPVFQGMHAARKDVSAVLQAETYDRAALEAALAKLWEKRAAMRESASKTFVDLVEMLSDDEKKAFGKFIEKDRRGRRGRWRRHKHHEH